MLTWNEKFDKFVGHFSKYQDQTYINKESDNAIKVIDSDVGRRVGFNY